MTALDWRTYASCLALDVNEFFPEKGGGRNRAIERTCGRCDVRQQCLDFAIDQGIWDGIWGGLTPVPRRRIAKARRIEQAAS